ncbi:hypothetical protein [Spirulina subsalsa]|uniref:hypothetical protein n=1 Tax=Spirulina subsalsa TaxID=54311 RepID=UPI0002E7B65D|nr:hypothetical protein [Spirulina subsalsa]
MEIILTIALMVLAAILLPKELNLIYRFMIHHRPLWLAWTLGILMILGGVDALVKTQFFDAFFGFCWFLWLCPPVYEHLLERKLINPVKQRWNIQLESYILVFLFSLYFAGGEGFAKLYLLITSHSAFK